MITIRRDLFLRLKTSIQFFNNFSDDELLTFLRLMHAEKFKDQAVIFREFEPGDKMYILVQGGVKISKRIGKQDGVVVETEIASLEPGECFGEIGLIDRRPRSASATCAGDTLLFSITVDKIIKISRNPNFSILSFKLFRNFSIMLATRLRETNQKVVDLTARFGTSHSKLVGSHEDRIEE